MLKGEKYAKEKDIKYRSYVFAIRMVKFVKLLDKRDFSLEIIAKQLLRAATSIGANIIEAKASSSRKDFTNFYHHALKSANETRFWLGILRDSEITNHKNIIDELLKEAVELSNILGKCIISLKKQ